MQIDHEVRIISAAGQRDALRYRGTVRLECGNASPQLAPDQLYILVRVRADALAHGIGEAAHQIGRRG